MKRRCSECGKKKNIRKFLFHSRHPRVGSICLKCERKDRFGKLNKSLLSRRGKEALK